jgi:hypothetical protein
MSQQDEMSARPAAGTRAAPERSAVRRRTGPIAGLIGLACYTAGALTAALPGPGTATPSVIAHLADHRSAVLAGTMLTVLALPFLLLFLGSLVTLLAEAEGPPRHLALLSAGAWLMLFAIIAAGMIPVAAVAWRGGSSFSPAIVRLAIDASNLSLYSLSAPVAAASVLAPTIVIWRRRLLPRWLVWLALAEVAVNVAELAGLFARSGLDASGYAAGAGPLLWILWAAVLCAALLVPGAPAAPSITSSTSQTATRSAESR